MTPAGLPEQSEEDGRHHESLLELRARRELGDRVIHPLDYSVAAFFPRPVGWLAKLHAWLYARRGESLPVNVDPLSSQELKVRFRLAPSIIVRSEAELLAISSPRFAFRVYLSDSSFINCRRLVCAHTAIRKAYTATNSEVAGAEALQKREELLTRLLADVLRASWIADSMLEVPQDLLDAGFRFLACDLSRDYDEPQPNTGRPIVPFMRHIGFGGGLCAQAACFMALCMIRGARVIGPSEITALLPTEHPSRLVEIKGMYHSQFQGLFEGLGCGLTTRVQVTAPPVSQTDEPAEDAWKNHVVPELRATLKGYLQSGSPVVFLVSALRMFQLETNPATLLDRSHPVIQMDERTREQREEAPFAFLRQDRSHVPLRVAIQPGGTTDLHSVVLCGWHSDGNQFVLNDPGTLPFLSVTATQLVDIRPYVSRKAVGIVGKPVDEPTATKSAASELSAVCFFPVVNQKVKSFLATVSDHPDKDKDGNGGLVRRAADEQVAFPTDDTLPTYRHRDYTYGDWWLAEAAGGTFRGQFGTSCPFAESIQQGLQHLLTNWTMLRSQAATTETGSSLPNWFWIQYIDLPDANGQSECSIWLWNAEIEHADVESAELFRILVAVLLGQRKSDGHQSWKIVVPQ